MSSHLCWQWRLSSSMFTPLTTSYWTMFWLFLVCCFNLLTDIPFSSFFWFSLTYMKHDMHEDWWWRWWRRLNNQIIIRPEQKVYFPLLLSSLIFQNNSRRDEAWEEFTFSSKEGKVNMSNNTCSSKIDFIASHSSAFCTHGVNLLLPFPFYCFPDSRCVFFSLVKRREQLFDTREVSCFIPVSSSCLS